MSTLEELKKAVEMFSGYVSCCWFIYFVLCDFGENGPRYGLMFKWKTVFGFECLMVTEWNCGMEQSCYYSGVWIIL